MPDKLVTLRLYNSRFEAQLVRAELETLEIDVFVPDEHTIGVNWQWLNLLGGVKLQVPETQVEAANEALLAERNPHDMPEGATNLCGVCGSANTQYSLARKAAILTWLVLGAPLFPVASKQVCGDCGHKWKL